MKRIINLIISIAILNVLIVGCEKEDKNDPDPVLKNHFKYDNVEHDLSNGYMVDYGADTSIGENIYNIDIELFSSGITYIINDTNESISGTGDLLYFEIYTSTPGKLVAGEYPYSSTEKVGTFDWSEVYINFNWETEEGTYFDINAGKLTVKLEGNEYEITLDCTADNGKSVTGYYKGSLSYFVVPDGWKSTQKKGVNK